MSVSKNGKHKSITSIADLNPDTKNANKGSQRGRGLLEKSLRQYGAGRSVLTDKNGNLIAGNKTIDVAAELDLPVKVVQTNGEQVVVVQRTDLDINSAAGRGLAIADNRTSEVSIDWDANVLADLANDVDLLEFWKGDELAELMGGLEEEATELNNTLLLEKAMQLKPQKEYIVLVCEEQSEFEELKLQLDLRHVRKGGYKKGSAFDAVGVQRVVPAATLLEKLKK